VLRLAPDTIPTGLPTDATHLTSCFRKAISEKERLFDVTVSTFQSVDPMRSRVLCPLGEREFPLFLARQTDHRKRVRTPRPIFAGTLDTERDAHYTGHHKYK